MFWFPGGWPQPNRQAAHKISRVCSDMKFTPAKRRKFIRTLAATANVTRSAAAVGVSRRHVYDVRAADPEFKRQWDDAINSGIDDLEGEAFRRARDGVPEPLVSMGKVVRDDDGKPMMIRKYSDTLMVTLLKAHRPDKYREK